MPVLRSVRRSFWRGLASLFPALLTFAVLAGSVALVHKYVGRYVNSTINRILTYVAGAEPPANGDYVDFLGPYYLHWVGVVVAILGLCAGAYFVGTFVGLRLLRIIERSLMKFPVFRRIYPGAKQVSEFFFSERKVEFRRVVAIEYPRRGIWSIGFVTGRSFRALAQQTETELLTVFIPSSPTPFTGYVVAVPRREVVDLPITVDEAFQYSISGGVIVPPAERLESLEAALQVSEGEELTSEQLAELTHVVERRNAAQTAGVPEDAREEETEGPVEPEEPTEPPGRPEDEG